jgi:methyl-accepting chemotaxis protein
MLEEITTDVSKIMEMNTAIAYSIKEQSSVASEVNQYVLMIRDVAGQTGKSATENKQTSEELSLQANILNKEVNSFSV